MDVFFCNDIKDVGNIISLPQSEVSHIFRVMRKNIGDIIFVSDGNGKVAEVEIIELNKKNCLANVNKLSVYNNDRLYNLHLAVAPTKMIDRYEWMVEKCMEIGVSSITPIICEHSERKVVKLERLHNILISAMKQSGNVFLPKINDVISFKDFINNSLNCNYNKYIAHCEDYIKNENVQKENLQKGNNKKGNDKKDFFKELKIGDNLLLIGPEGDFSPSEIDLAINSNFMPVSLGTSILRVETAAVYSSVCNSLKNTINNSINNVCIK